MIEEIWKDITGYEGLYQISTLGNVKILNYKKTGKSKIKKTYSKNGYLRLALYKDGKPKNFFVHRLVGEAFIPNSEGKLFINHRDEIRDHNWVENLEWCDNKYNSNYGHCREKISKAMLGNKNFRLTTAKQIKCLDLETNEITYYPSVNEAARQLMINHTSILNKLRKPSKPYKNRFIFTEINKEKDTLS